MRFWRAARTVACNSHAIIAMIERTVERLFFASRWLLAPIYLGLSVALVVLGIQFFEELYPRR